MDTETAKRIVKEAEEAYRTGDRERVRELFQPDVVVYWNGKKRHTDRESIIRGHEANGEFDGSKRNRTLKKTLRAVTGDTIGVEWEGTHTDADGTLYRSFGGEFWRIRDGKLAEWRAYSTGRERVDE